MVVRADGLQALLHVPARLHTGHTLPRAPLHMHTCAAHMRIHMLTARSYLAPGTPESGSQRLCTPPPACPGHITLLTLLLHATLQALAQAAGLALPPGLPCDLTGALPEGAPQPGVSFHGPPVREQRANGRPWGTSQGALGHPSLSACPCPIQGEGTLATPAVGSAFASELRPVHKKGRGKGSSSFWSGVWVGLPGGPGGGWGMRWGGGQLSCNIHPVWCFQ